MLIKAYEANVREISHEGKLIWWDFEIGLEKDIFIFYGENNHFKKFYEMRMLK